MKKYVYNEEKLTFEESEFSFPKGFIIQIKILSIICLTAVTIHFLLN